MTRAADTLEDAETYRQALEALRNIHSALLGAMAIRGARIRVLEDQVKVLEEMVSRHRKSRRRAS